MKKERVCKIVMLYTSIVSLFIGGIIYILFRRHTLNMFVFLRNIGIEHFFVQRTFNYNSAIQRFIIFSLPNGLWLLSIIIIFAIIWKNSKKWFYIYSSAFTGFNIIAEILQKFDVIPGTFDLFDVSVLLIFHIIGILIYIYYRKGVSSETNKMD